MGSASASYSPSHPVFALKSPAEDLLDKCKSVSSGKKSVAEAGITAEWMEPYEQVAEREDHEQRFCFSCYPFQAGNAASAFIGGFFDIEEWQIRRQLSKQQIMYSLAENEAKYINAAGYWCVLHHVPFELRQEVFVAGKKENAKKFDA